MILSLTIYAPFPLYSSSLYTAFSQENKTQTQNPKQRKWRQPCYFILILAYANRITLFFCLSLNNQWSDQKTLNCPNHISSLPRNKSRRTSGLWGDHCVRVWWFEYMCPCSFRSFLVQIKVTASYCLSHSCSIKRRAKESFVVAWRCLDCSWISVSKRSLGSLVFDKRRLAVYASSSKGIESAWFRSRLVRLVFGSKYFLLLIRSYFTGNRLKPCLFFSFRSCSTRYQTI